MSTEHWKPIPGWEHRYEASTEGRIRSLDMRVQGRFGVCSRRGRVLSPVAKKGNYHAVTLADGVVRKQYLVHEIIALTFLGPRPPGYEVLHAGDVRFDNSLRRLRYGTREENEIERQQNGRVAKGERHGMAKLTEIDVAFIRSAATSNQVLAESLGVSTCAIWAVRTKRSWRHI